MIARPDPVDRLTIIGAGDVVARRMLPAIAALGLARRVRLFHHGICEVDAAHRADLELIALPGSPGAAADALARSLEGNSDPVIVATPPEVRLELALVARRSQVPLILEKPLCAGRSDLDGFRALFAEGKRLFALSYYVQEKALAWTWLHGRDPGAVRLLTLASGASMPTLAPLIEALGEPRQLRIAIKEGAGRSGHAGRPAWYESRPNGVWLDMGVHAVSLIMLALLPLNPAGRQDAVSPRPGAPRMIARPAGQVAFELEESGVGIEVEFGKGYAPEACERQLVAHYRYGALRYDFDTGLCTLRLDDGRSNAIGLAMGNGRYLTLMRKVWSFIAAGEWNGPRGDQLMLQLDALDWILRWSPSVGEDG